eukprot:IDg16746t1
MFQSKVGYLYQNKRTTGLITCRLLTRMYENIPILTAFDLAKELTRNWAFSYGILKAIPAYNGRQFNAEFCNRYTKYLERNPVPTNYHLKANGQTELPNRTMLASLRRFVADNSKD